MPVVVSSDLNGNLFLFSFSLVAISLLKTTKHKTPSAASGAGNPESHITMRHLIFMCVLQGWVASTVSLVEQYPNLSEGADSISGQICRDKECPFSGITSYGSVWRKVPESEARSVMLAYTLSGLVTNVPQQ